MSNAGEIQYRIEMNQIELFCMCNTSPGFMHTRQVFYLSYIPGPEWVFYWQEDIWKLWQSAGDVKGFEKKRYQPLESNDQQQEKKSFHIYTPLSLILSMTLF